MMATSTSATEINGASASGCENWNACLGEAAWLRFPLEHNLKYASPLPVQQAVIPTVARALLSGIPMDVSLTAPTGSGKTLCYLLPALRLITCEKKGVDRTALRAVILVPTKALGQQVFREVQRLIRNTSITATSLCDDVETIKTESWELMRYATTVLRSGDATAVQQQRQSEWVNAVAEDGSAEEDNNQRIHSGEGTQYSTMAFSKVDLLVATPQRLLRHLDGATPGFSLAALRLLIIDEADQVLAGSFASFVSKVVDRFEAEQAQRRAAELDALRRATSSSVSASPITARLLASTTTTGVLHTILCSATLSSRVGRVSEVRLRNCVHYMLDSHGQDVADSAAGDERALTTTSHSRGFLKTTFALPPTLQEHIVFVADAYRHAALLKLVTQLVASIQKRHAEREKQRVKKQRAMEKESSDSDDEDRDAAPTSAADVSASPHTTATGSSSSNSNSSDYPATDDDSGTGILVFCSSAEEARVVGHLLTAAGVAGVVEFTTLATESERRRALLGPLRSDSGMGKTSGLVESDSAEVGLRTETHRGRKASSSSSSSSLSPMCVVASDALMRGIDIPNIGHVIMYHPPTSISQYVHRAGRTARAMRSGHLHLLLSKTGRGGTQQDGEMALFKVLSEQLTRTLPVRYERHFFYFDKAPPKKEKVTEAPKEAQATVVAVPPATSAAETETEPETKAETEAEPAPSPSTPLPVPTETPTEDVAAGPSPAEIAPVRTGSGEWWVETADRYLQQSQHHLQRMWASALETALREAKATRTAEAAAVTNTEAHAQANAVSPVGTKAGQSGGRPQMRHKPHGTPSKASHGAPHAKRAPSKRGAGQKRGRE